MKSLTWVTPGEAFNARQLYGAYSIVPDWVASIPKLSGNAKVIYARLLRYAQTSGRAFPSYETLGKYVGLSERQAQRLCHELRDKKIIKIHRRKKSGTNQNQTSVFEFLYRPEMDAVAPDQLGEEYEEEPTDTCDVNASEPKDICDTDPTDTYGTEPKDTCVRVTDKQIRDKKEESVQQQQSTREKPAAVVAATRFPKTLGRLRKQRFPIAKAGEKWERRCSASGYLDEDFDKVAHGIDWVDFFAKGATSPIPVIEEAIAWLDKHRPRRRVCDTCGESAWHCFTENEAICNGCNSYRHDVGAEEVTARLFETACLHHCCDDELFKPGELAGAGPCSECGCEWQLLFEDGKDDCASCCSPSVLRYNPALAKEFKRRASEGGDGVPVQPQAVSA